MTLVCSELFRSCNYCKVPTVSNKDCAFTRRNVNFAIVTVINIDIGSNIEDEVF